MQESSRKEKRILNLSSATIYLILLISEINFACGLFEFGGPAKQISHFNHHLEPQADKNILGENFNGQSLNAVMTQPSEAAFNLPYIEDQNLHNLPENFANQILENQFKQPQPIFQPLQRSIIEPEIHYPPQDQSFANEPIFQTPQHITNVNSAWAQETSPSEKSFHHNYRHQDLGGHFEQPHSGQDYQDRLLEHHNQPIFQAHQQKANMHSAWAQDTPNSEESFYHNYRYQDLGGNFDQLHSGQGYQDRLLEYHNQPVFQPHQQTTNMHSSWAQDTPHSEESVYHQYGHQNLNNHLDQHFLAKSYPNELSEHLSQPIFQPLQHMANAPSAWVQDTFLGKDTIIHSREYEAPKANLESPADQSLPNELLKHQIQSDFRSPQLIKSLPPSWAQTFVSDDQVPIDSKYLFESIKYKEYLRTPRCQKSQMTLSFPEKGIYSKLPLSQASNQAQVLKVDPPKDFPNLPNNFQLSSIDYNHNYIFPRVHKTSNKDLNQFPNPEIVSYKGFGKPTTEGTKKKIVNIRNKKKNLLNRLSTNHESVYNNLNLRKHLHKIVKLFKQENKDGNGERDIAHKSMDQGIQNPTTDHPVEKEQLKVTKNVENEINKHIKKTQGSDQLNIPSSAVKELSLEKNSEVSHEENVITPKFEKENSVNLKKVHQGLNSSSKKIKAVDNITSMKEGPKIKYLTDI
ncbi:hypothetical protein BY996DRAFT_6409491 [Phakopsora pachyrhizi]|nr:hypothetical protein BY996DRAFT_6410107 [Phakopsora pachyrhizi]KAI8460274.1 hypothetical protein BY996DRAFT_6409491 [Phakopsora pachyrhizi]